MSRYFTTNAASLDDLLAETRWIQNLARALVGNSATAEDVAQDTMVIALEHPPSEVSDQQGLRNWLGAVVRRVARHSVRGEARREYRQQVAAKEGFEASSHDVVERYSLQRRVAEGVMSIAEPHRSTLLLFYFDDLSVKEVAERTKAQAATVRKRLSRGRELLRDALDQEFGEDCRGWLRGLVVVPMQPAWRKFAPIGIGLAAVVGVLGLLASADEDQGEPALSYAKSIEPEAEDENRDIVVASLSHAVPAMPARQDADQVAAKLNDEMGLELTEVTRLEVRKPLDEIKALAERASVKVELFKSAEVFSAQTRHPQTGKQIAAVVARLYLPDISRKARIVVAVADGRPIGMGLWGTPEFDEDPDQRWGLFANLLMFKSRQAVIGEASDTPSEITKRIAVLSADKENGAFVDALIQQRVVMLANTQYTRGVKLREKAGALPSTEWFAALAKGMEELASSSSALERVLGEETERHADQARTTAKHYLSMSAAIEAGEKERYEELASAQGNLCRSCHDAVLADKKTTWFDAFDPVAREFDLPQGVLRVGYDLTPALGDDGVVSEKLASALRAGLMYLDALK